MSKLFARACSKLTSRLFHQKINLPALRSKMDFRHFLPYGNSDTQLLHRLTDGCLFRRFTFVHASAREDEIVQSRAVALDQRDFVVFDQYDAGANSHVSSII